MNFEILGDISNIEVIAVDSSIREVERLHKAYGSGCWSKQICPRTPLPMKIR